MSKKDALFIIGLCILMGVVWVIGEVVMGLWIAASAKVHIIWFVSIVVITVGVNVWHSMIDDESDRTNPKIEKYKRKTEKRK